MSSELNLHTASGLTIKALVLGQDRSTRWNGSALVAWDAITDANWAVGLVVMTEELTSDGTGTGTYVGDFPTGINAEGEYPIEFFSGAAPVPGQQAVGIQTVNWNGTAAVSLVVSAATRYVYKSWRVEGVLTNVTTATYGLVKAVGSVEVVPSGTAMTSDETGVYYFSFTDTEDVAYTATIVFVYADATYTFEVDVPARSSTDGMTANYSSLLERVGHFLFGIRSAYSSDQTADIKECIKDGLNDVYTSHSWSFFRPIEPITTVAPYNTGTIEVVDGVVTLSDGTFPSWAAVGVLKTDNKYYNVGTYTDGTTITLEDTSVDVDAGTGYKLGRPVYDLPTAFEAIEGDLTYGPGQSSFYPPVRQKHDSEIRRLQQYNPYHDRPIHFGIRTVEFDPLAGSRRQMSLYPTPDAVYVLKARMKLRSTMIDAVNQYPVGGESLSQVITEACLAAAERNYDEQEGRHTKRFQELLPLAIVADQEMTSPTQLGPDAPRGENVNTISRSSRMGDVTFEGVTL